MDIVTIILRIVHIVGGVYWVGSSMFLTAIFEPVMSAAAPQERSILARVVTSPKWSASVASAGGLTVLAGIILFIMKQSQYGTGTRIVFGIGGLAGIIALIIGGAVVGRLSKQLGALGAQAASAGGPPSAEIQGQLAATQADLSRWSRINLVVTLIAVISMSIARYVA
jgi:uncharacterized membrane protein